MAITDLCVENLPATVSEFFLTFPESEIKRGHSLAVGMLPRLDHMSGLGVEVGSCHANVRRPRGRTSCARSLFVNGKVPIRAEPGQTFTKFSWELRNSGPKSFPIPTARVGLHSSALIN